MESLTRLFCQVKLLLAVILLQFGYAGLSIIVKFALNQGMSHYNLFYLGMKYTDTSFTSAMCNILPASAFFMAWVFRLEMVNIRRLQSQAKILGTIVAVGGAFLMTIIKGPSLNLLWTEGRNPHDQSASAAHKQDLIKGALIIIASCFFWSCFIILQALTLKSYPAKLSLTTLICISGMVEGTIVALAFEKGNVAVWSIHWDYKLLAINYYIMGVITERRGPVFYTAFNPLCTVIVAILGSIIFAEEMNLGKVIGAIVIVIGLYLFLWGKRKEDQPTPVSQ
ncbi:hypothetical protein RGQ29_028944 [Quercus rubra]|uniref:WAT1-related protein n=1 Tax=Quercus rubra TaxID=3512 RepID=A0AAN7ETL6_QUERU|nr:hypothetical protein RGQ29_028944 [Quercus rubra]